MRRRHANTPGRGVVLALVVVGPMLALPAQAQTRPSLNTIDAKIEDVRITVDDTNLVVNEIKSTVEDTKAVVDGGPLPIDACGTIDLPGAYVLTQNLSASGIAPGHCLVVAASFVTIDLNGFVIDGRDIGTGISDDRTAEDSPRHSIKVRNGSVTRFQDGINLLTANASVVEHVRVIDNRNFGITVGIGSKVADNVANGNDDGGFFVRRGSTVTGNVADSNGTLAEGVVNGFTVGDASTVSGNTARGNGSAGIDCGLGCTVTGNTAQLNGTRGIRAGARSTVTGNTARDNGNPGIEAGEGSTLSGNTVRDNFVGLFVTCPSNVIGNTATINLGGNLILVGAGCGNFQNVAP